MAETGIMHFPMFSLLDCYLNQNHCLPFNQIHCAWHMLGSNSIFKFNSKFNHVLGSNSNPQSPQKPPAGGRGGGVAGSDTDRASGCNLAQYI